jgi:hypothetical protein
MMDELNTRLRQLATEAQQYPSKSPERQRRLAKLFSEIQKSGQIAYYHSLCPSMLRGSYQEIYDEALQITYCHITEKINQYDPSKGEVLAWFNNTLKWKFLDTIPNFQLPSSIIPITSIDKLSQIPSNPEESLPSAQIIEIIEEDPEKLFENTYLGNNKQANFKYIALQRYKGISWQVLSSELELNIANLSNFYQRSLKKFAPIIRKYLQ